MFMFMLGWLNILWLVERCRSGQSGTPKRSCSWKVKLATLLFVIIMISAFLLPLLLATWWWWWGWSRWWPWPWLYLVITLPGLATISCQWSSSALIRTRYNELSDEDDNNDDFHDGIYMYDWTVAGCVSYLRDVVQKKMGKCGNFEKTGGGLPKSHFFCNLTGFFWHAKFILRC